MNNSPKRSSVGPWATAEWSGLIACTLGFVLLGGCGSSDAGSGDAQAGRSGSQAAGAASGAGMSAAGAAQAGTPGSAGAFASSGGSAGAGNAGASNGGSSNAGSPSGGASAGGRAGASAGGAGNGSAGRGGANAGGSGNGGSTAGSAGAGGTATTGGVFTQDRFHFGTIDSKAKSAGSSMISQLDFFTSGWMLSDTFDHKGVCDDTKAGGALANLVPVQVAYISAAHVKRQDNTVCDCNVTGGNCVATNDLCHVGAQRIAQQFTTIVNAYKSYSQGFASCYGTSKPIVFELEPDWYQYTTSSQTQPWTSAQAGQMLGQIVVALKSSLPNARFSIDASPWVAPTNGMDNGKAWYANFDLSLFTFVNTSGGGTNANTVKIRTPNNMTWAGLSQVTGKPILADTGYGANGAPAGEDALWNDPANINARIADGVVSVSQYNPQPDWGTRVAAFRSKLNPLKFKP